MTRSFPFILKLHILDLEASLQFYTKIVGLTEAERRSDSAGRYTVIQLCSHEPHGERFAGFALELHYCWDPDYPKKQKCKKTKENPVSLCFTVENFLEVCEKIRLAGGAILRRAQDGSSILTRCPDDIPVELLRRS